MGGFVRKQKGMMMMMMIIITVVITLVLQASTSYCCTLNERAALLQIKAFFVSYVSNADQVWRDYVNSELRSWDDHSNGSCCSWNRVWCNQPPLQHVTKLELGGLTTYRNDPPYALNVTLFQPFENLTNLDLSYSSFARLEGSEGICKLKYLQQLLLHNSDLSGSLPLCLAYLTCLEDLDLSYNNLSGDVISILSNLTSLKHLSLSRNHFQGEFSFGSFVNHSKLEYLMLSYSGLQVKVADTLSPSAFQLKALLLSGCSLYMQSSTFQQFLVRQHQLLWLDISHNGLAGSFPTWIFHNNSRIEILVLRNNSFQGILGFPANATIQSLVHLDVSMNQFYGYFPANIGFVMPMLGYLNASDNAFQGEIPASIGDMTHLSGLDLSNNNFSGQVPSSIFIICASLKRLMLSSNSLHGDIIPEHMNLPWLESLSLDNNHFNGTIQKALLKSDLLMYLDLSKNEMAGVIPSWICSFSQLTLLSMSNNQLQGDIPSELYNLQMLKVLDLSYNSLNGTLPSSYNLSWIEVLILRNNHLSGALPTALSTSSLLVILDLTHNSFSGTIPLWISHLSNLQVLMLGNNRLHSEVPVELCRLHHINMMDLSSNNIFGVIPACLGNMSFGNTSLTFDVDTLSAFDLVSFFSSIQGIEYLSDLLPLLDFEPNEKEEVIFLSKRRYDSYKGYILGHMSGLDLSCNQLRGEIPSELGQLEHIHVLNLSHNQLFGSIPINFSMLRSVESLDLSYNNLSGEVPWQLVQATTLETFNVSYNNLSGEVPETSQFATFGDNSYLGNPFLCGSYLEHKCATLAKLDDTKETEDINVGFDWEVFLWSFGMSSAIMWLAAIGVLWINPYWRRAWFQFIDYHVIWWLY